MSSLRFKSKNRHWELEAPAHVLLRAKRVFGKASSKSMGKLFLSDTIETARDLEWFAQRYPLEMDEESAFYLELRSSQHKEEEDIVAALLSGRRELPSFELAVPPRDYQREAAAMALCTGGLLLSDEVGLGKSVSSICALTDPSTLPALVVTLTHLPTQWQRELNRFAPNLRTHIVKKGTPYDLTAPARGELQSQPFPDVIICNYAKLGGWAETLAPVVRSIILDECQELRTGASTTKYHAVKHIAENCRLRYGLSATPIFNYGGEIWNVLNVLRPGALGTYAEFEREWGQHLGRDRLAIGDPRAFGTYARDTGLILRRTRRDVGRELPPLSNVPQHVDSDERVLESVEDSCAELARIILSQADQRRGERWLASEDFSNKLRQATGIAKAWYVAEFVKMLVAAGEKVVLYGWHRSVHDIWMKRLEEHHPVLFTGSESAAQKQRSLEAFTKGDSKVLVMSLRSGAGVDGLQHCCRTVVYGELDWSPQVHVQCSGRVFRDGQPDPVIAYYLISDTGSDPIVSDVLGIKRQQSDGLLDPDRPVAEFVGVPKDHVARLATDYLARRGLSLQSEGTSTEAQRSSSATMCPGSVMTSSQEL